MRIHTPEYLSCCLLSLKGDLHLNDPNPNFKIRHSSFAHFEFNLPSERAAPYFLFPWGIWPRRSQWKAKLTEYPRRPRSGIHSAGVPGGPRFGSDSGRRAPGPAKEKPASTRALCWPRWRSRRISYKNRWKWQCQEKSTWFKASFGSTGWCWDLVLLVGFWWSKVLPKMCSQKRHGEPAQRPVNTGTGSQFKSDLENHKKS